MNLLKRTFPLAVTSLAVLAAVAVNLFASDWRLAPFESISGSVLLASPFITLLIAHLTLRATFDQQIFLAVGNVPMYKAWTLVSFAMVWFELGWAGVVFFSIVMAACAMLYIALVRLILRPKAPP